MLSRDANPNAYTHIAPMRTQIPVSRIFTHEFLRDTLFSTTSKDIADYDDPIKRMRNLPMRLGTKRRKLKGASFIAVALMSFVSSCGTSVTDVCSQAVSVPSFSTRFLMGLDNFSEDQYENLRVDSLRTRATLAQLRDLYPDDESVRAVLQQLDSFIDAMESTQWDVSLALRNPTAVQGAMSLGSTETIAQANHIDALVISLCGLPSTFVPNDSPGATLPMPWIPAPNDTEPDTNIVNDESEIYALGEMVGTLFQLTLTPDEVRCIGQELVDVVDKSDATSNSQQYQMQFQKAFDVCEIPFTLPVE